MRRPRLSRPYPLRPEQQKRRRWARCAEAVREQAKEEQYLTLSDLCAWQEMPRDEAADMMRELMAQEEYGDICVYQGAKDLYYYTYPTLAHNYVKNVALAQENDLPHTIAEIVRYESKIYPRATSIDTFSRYPYHYTAIQIRRTLERMAKQPEYADIETYVSGKKQLYVFSTQYLSRTYAKTLVEMSEDKRMWL
ncbi:MAG: hypothetical protein Q4G52_00005 [Clostridia bacterium]|nr:hypothetical protein [Clostridia bacterium]